MVIFSAVWVPADECGAQWVWRLPGAYAAGHPSFSSSPRKCGLRGNLLCSVLGRGGWVPREGNRWEDTELDQKPHPPLRRTLALTTTCSCCPRIFAHAAPSAGSHLLLWAKPCALCRSHLRHHLIHSFKQNFPASTRFTAPWTLKLFVTHLYVPCAWHRSW